MKFLHEVLEGILSLSSFKNMKVRLVSVEYQYQVSVISALVRYPTWTYFKVANDLILTPIASVLYTYKMLFVSKTPSKVLTLASKQLS